MKAFNVARKYGSRIAVAGAALVGSAGSAIAAVPAEVTTALGDMKTDALIVGGAFLVCIIALAALKMMRRSM